MIQRRIAKQIAWHRPFNTSFLLAGGVYTDAEFCHHINSSSLQNCPQVRAATFDF